MPDASRREFLAGIGVLGATTQAPAFLSPSGSNALTPAARNDLANQIQAGTDGTPVWHVWLESSDRRESLDEWLGNDTDNRTLRSEHDALEMVTVAAPNPDIGVGLYERLAGGGLQSKSWIARIEPALSVSLADPIQSLENASAWETNLRRPTKLFGSLRGGGLPQPDGVAFSDDASPNTMQAAKKTLNADAVTADTSQLDIAVIDTGVDSSSIFETDTGASRIMVQSKDMLTGETVSDGGVSAVADENGHGTFVASQILARAPSGKSEHEGILPAADLLAIRALDADGSGSTERIAKAITYAADQNVDVICMSLGAPTWSQALDDALAYAVAAGAIPVAAAGNSRMRTVWTASPADSENAIAVGATTAPTDARNAESAYFSNVGPDPGTTDLSEGSSRDATPLTAAPGMQQRALVDAAQVETKSGTSMAAPNVAGAIGLLLAKTDGLSYEDVRTKLLDHGTRVPAMAAAESQSGIVDVDAMLAGMARDASQSEAMNDDAEGRDASYRGLSVASGGLLPW